MEDGGWRMEDGRGRMEEVNRMAKVVDVKVGTAANLEKVSSFPTSINPLPIFRILTVSEASDGIRCMAKGQRRREDVGGKEKGWEPEIEGRVSEDGSRREK